MLDVNNFCKNLTIKAISTHIGYNPEYTAKKIEKIFGMKYSRLLVKLRMSYAREQLGATEKTLEEIAALVGYQSYNGFHIAFKKYYGQTPEQIRNTLRGQARNDQI